MTDNPVTEREFERYIKAQNGSLARIERSVDEVKRMLGDSQRQMLDLLDSEVSTRENGKEKCTERFDELSEIVGAHDAKLSMTLWVWRGIVGFLGVALTTLSILVLVRVI